ncbi:DUF6416 domain-containing protein [Streptomyces sp. P17]|uniref:DUF6416 domain-containing protein n=1 Tax=Streptomyces sp. P17 TaxID=3074716 RepID=UPI0028F43766|nr:DUF6416 domain-containing protein [Streptomyces sp. P17]MDT9700117.1 DUF6416 domain-containing protein [Streptomyces sp. P17]
MAGSIDGHSAHRNSVSVEADRRAGPCGAPSRGRWLPFYWWEAPERSAGATYAVRPSVAAVFLAAQLGAA